ELSGDLVRQRILSFKRIGVNVSRRSVRQGAVDFNGTTCRRSGCRINPDSQGRIRWIAEGRTAGAERIKDLPTVKWSAEIACGGATANRIARQERRIATRV